LIKKRINKLRYIKLENIFSFKKECSGGGDEGNREGRKIRERIYSYKHTHSKANLQKKIICPVLG
jgi:hypothetical protein